MSGSVRRCVTRATIRNRYEDIIFCRLLRWKCNSRSSSSSTPPEFTATSTSSRPLSSASEDPVAASSAASPSPSPSCPPPPPTSSSRWNLVKFGGLAALTGVLGTTAYATYANTLDEVEEMSRPLLDSSNYSVGDDSSALEKFRAMAYSTAMKGPV